MIEQRAVACGESEEFVSVYRSLLFDEVNPYQTREF